MAQNRMAFDWLAGARDGRLYSFGATTSCRPPNQGDAGHVWGDTKSEMAETEALPHAEKASPTKPNFLPNGRSRLTLRVKGLKYMAEHAPSLVPDLSEDDIRDKGNADGLAKLLVCLQATWFCVQCIVRLAQKQAISFLELNTFGHAVCALLTYLLWWQKPLDIDSPSLLEEEEAWEICALMCVTSTGEDFWDDAIQIIFQHVFSEIREDTKLSRGQKYGDRIMANWTEVLNGRHLARLRQHRSEPRMVLRWEPVPDPTGPCWPKDDEPLSVAPNMQPQPQPRTTWNGAVRIKKDDFFFGFRCMDVYTQADWYLWLEE
ncbi:MAG: hypothetical protein Q9181_004675 [Wetmoreana brouardii]